MICGRCHRECNGFTGSYFDTASICFRCDEVERKHPAFEEARRVESAECARGNFNFRGVGVPADLVAMCITAAGIAEVTDPPEPTEKQCHKCGATLTRKDERWQHSPDDYERCLRVKVSHPVSERRE